MSIELRDVKETADYVVELSERVYKRARVNARHDTAHDHRQSCLDNLEGLKALLIRVEAHDTDEYNYICKLWNEVLRWP